MRAWRPSKPTADTERIACDRLGSTHRGRPVADVTRHLLARAGGGLASWRATAAAKGLSFQPSDRAARTGMPPTPRLSGVNLRSHRAPRVEAPPPPKPPTTIAKHTPLRKSRGLLERLRDREVSASSSTPFLQRSARERFANLRARTTVDMFTPSQALPPGFNQMMSHRCRITELCAAKGAIFGLTENGVCASYDTRTGTRLCVLNRNHSEVVRSLFYNRASESLITVSVFQEDGYSCLRCRETRIEDLKHSTPSHGEALFESESLRWPGFVEFDDVNGKVLTFSSDVSVYKVWSLAIPNRVLYSFSDLPMPNLAPTHFPVPEGISEIKISPGIMLIVCNRHEETSIPLRLLSIESGETLRVVKQPIRRGKKVDIIEQFNEKLMLKQEGCPLLIVDLLTDSVVKVKDSFFRTPNAFIYLYENQAFLAFKDNCVTVWNFRGELISTFEDHKLCFPIPDIDHTSVIFITQAQDIIISLCEDGGGGAGAGEVEEMAAVAEVVRPLGNAPSTVATRSSRR